MNAISMSVSVSVSDPKDLVLVHQAMERLMADLNSINSMSVQKPVIALDPATGFVAKPVIEVAAPEPKVKRVRSAKQLAHDKILREQSIARHLALGHTVKAEPNSKPASKKSKKAPAANQGLLQRPAHVTEPLVDQAIKNAKKSMAAKVARIQTKDDDVPEGFEHPVLVETRYADGSVKVTKDLAKKNKPAPKPVKKVSKLSKEPIKVSELVSKRGRKVAAANPAE